MSKLNSVGMTTLLMLVALSTAGCKEPVAVPPSAAAISSENLIKAKAAVDRMVGAQDQFVAGQGAANGDAVKLKENNDAYERRGGAMLAEVEALGKSLTVYDKKALESYSRPKLAGELMSKLVAQLRPSSAAPPVAAPMPVSVAPAAAPPAPAVSDTDRIEKCLAELPTSQPFTGVLACLKKGRAEGWPTKKIEDRVVSTIIQPAAMRSNCIEAMAIAATNSCEFAACRSLCAIEHGCGYLTKAPKFPGPELPPSKLSACPGQVSDCGNLCISAIPRLVH